MSTLTRILQRAQNAPQRIVLCEGQDPRIQQAAEEAHARGLAYPILVDPEQPHHVSAAGTDTIMRHNPRQSALTAELGDLYYSLRKHKGLSQAEAHQRVLLPHVYAALLVKAGYADGFVGGACLTTAEVIKTVLQTIGKAKGQKLVSSFFLMLLENRQTAKEEPVIFGDAGLLVEPNAEALAELAIASAQSFVSFTAQEPRIAMLSFSTKGSANHPAATKMRDATNLVQQTAPDLSVDGEMQFDAAFVPDIGKSKAPGSKVAGRANIFIFPNLDAGNIGYKIAQRIGGATAIGPILQGLDSPANDLSRGCSVSDIVHMIAVTVIQAQLRDKNRSEN